jgi:hypothetical protein
MWTEKYYNNPIVYTKTLNYDLYISKLKNKYISKSSNINNKVNQLEQDYEEKMQLLPSLCDNVEEKNKIKQDYSLHILQKELDIIKLLTKYSLLNNTLDYNFLVKSLTFLLELSETLRLRLGQKIVPNDIDLKDMKETNIITRSSYKFCSYKDNCTYNYNFKDKNVCYQNHYVHNMVSADLKILIKYITTNYNPTINISHNKDILKTINTLSFVITHMESELKTKCLYLPKNEWDKFHIIKNK